jgi:hypothetical protein
MSQGVQIQYNDPQGNPRQLQGQFIGSKYSPITLNSGSGTTNQNMSVAPADKYTFVTAVQITVDATCTIGSAGMVNVNVTDSVDGVLATLRVFIPAAFAAPTVPTVLRQVSAPGSFWASSTKGSTITCNIGTALTAGSIRVSIIYGYSNVAIGN